MQIMILNKLLWENEHIVWGLFSPAESQSATNSMQQKVSKLHGSASSSVISGNVLLNVIYGYIDGRYSLLSCESGDSLFDI